MSKVTFDKLIIEKFSCIESAIIPLQNVGLCCIEGRIFNGGKELPDQIYQRSNGAGKSSVVEAWYFSLTGEFFDPDTTLNSIINRFTGSPAKLIINGVVGETPFEVTRTVESKSKRSSTTHTLEFVMGDQKVHEQTNSILQTQERINDFLGMNALLLLNSKIFGQGDISSFTNVNDRHKKIIIDNLVGIGICDKMCKTSKSLLTEITTTITTLNIELMGIKKNKDTLNTEIAELRQKEVTWEQQKQIEIDKLLTKIQSIEQGVKVKENLILSYQTVIKNLNYEDAKVKELEIELTKADILYKELVNKMNTRVANKNKLERDQSFLSGKLQNILDTTKRLVALYNKEGTICPTCLQQLDMKNFDSVCVSLNKERDDASIEVTNFTTEIQEIETGTAKLKTTEQQLISKVASIKNKIKGLQSLAKQEQELQQNIKIIQNEIAGTEREKTLINENISGVQKTTSPYSEMVQKKQEKLKDITIEIDTKTKEIEALEEDQRYYNLLAKAFDKDGIPQLISYDVLKILNKLLSKYKNKILGPDFDLMYVMKQKRNNEEIHLHVINPDGGEGYSRQSKGEKRKIDLCQMFTISDFAKMQNKCNLNVIWFDEIFSELDPYSCEVVLGIIKDYPADSKFIITHKDLFKDEFKNRIFVQKTGSTSTIKTNY